MSRRKRRGVASAVASAILAAFVIAAGLYLYALSLSWFGVSALKASSDVGGLAAMVSSSLVVEAGSDNGTAATLRLRNLGKYTLIVIRVEVFKRASDHDLILVASSPPSGFGNLLELQPEEVAILVAPSCSVCDEGDVAVYRITYLAKSLFDPDQPANNVHKARVAEYEIAYTGIAPRKCEIPSSKWIWMDISDPLQELGSGRLGDEYGLRFVRADSSANVRVTVTIRELHGAHRTYTSPITTLRSQHYAIQYINMPNLRSMDFRPPFEVIVSVESWTEIQYRWVHGSRGAGAGVSAFINTISLVWTEHDEAAHGVWLSVATTYTGAITVGVTIKDCDGDVVATGQATGTVRANDPKQIYVELDNPVSMWDVYEVETYVIT